MAHLKDLIPTEQRVSAFGEFESTFWLFTTFGPILGGLITQVIGVGLTLLSQVLGLLGSALGLPTPEREAPAIHVYSQQLSEGFRYIAADPTRAFGRTAHTLPYRNTAFTSYFR